jgi:hypothetical protein
VLEEHAPTVQLANRHVAAFICDPTDGIALFGHEFKANSLSKGRSILPIFNKIVSALRPLGYQVDDHRDFRIANSPFVYVGYDLLQGYLSAWRIVSKLQT